MDKAVWKPVIGYEGSYEVSSNGLVRSLDRFVRSKPECNGQLKKGKVLKLRAKREGYIEVALMHEGKAKYHLVHRLVAKAFIPNNEALPEVDHINGDATDNRIENLRWCTAKQNCRNPITLKRKSISMKKRGWSGGKHPLAKKVVNLDTGKVYAALVDAASAVGVCSKTIEQSCKTGWRAGGYHWNYV